MAITKGSSNTGISASIFQRPVFWLGVILVAFFFIRLQYLGIPFERDEGAYSFYGQQILNGAIPYLDFHEMKFPFLYYFYAGIQAIFGSTLEGVQIGFLLITTANVGLIYAVTRYFFKEEAALLGSAAYAVLSFNPILNAFTCQSEHGLVFFLLVGTLLITRWLKSGGNYLLIIAGFLAGLSFQIKQTAALLVLFLGLLIIAQHLWKTKPNFLKAILHGALFTGGFVVSLGIFAAFLWSRGAWEPFLFWTFEWPALYLSERTFSQGMDTLATRIGGMANGFWAVWIVGVLAFIGLLISKYSQKTKVGMAALMLLSIASIVPGLRFYGHYWIQLFPVFAIAFGAGAIYFKNWLTKNVGSGKMLYRMGVVVVLLSPLVLRSEIFFSPDHEQVLRDTYGMNPFPEMKRIAEYLDPKVEDGETMAVFGSEPQLYFYTNTVAPSSYSYFEHTVKSIDQSQQWQRAFLDSIESKQPRYIVYLQHPTSWNADKGAADGIENWANEYLNQHYAPVGVVDMMPGNVQYVFGQQALGYQPKSSGIIYVLQRRN